MDAPIEQLRAAMQQHAEEAEPLAQAVARWSPAPRPDGPILDPSKPHHIARDGSDLGQFPPEHVVRMRKDAQAALKAHDAVATSRFNPLIIEAQRGPARRLQLDQLAADGLPPGLFEAIAAEGQTDVSLAVVPMAGANMGALDLRADEYRGRYMAAFVPSGRLAAHRPGPVIGVQNARARVIGGSMPTIDLCPPGPPVIGAPAGRRGGSCSVSSSGRGCLARSGRHTRAG